MIEEKVQINENNIGYALDMLSIPINQCFKAKKIDIKVNDEIMRNNDTERIIDLFKRDKYLSIKVDDKVAIVFFKNNFIIKKGENENNYKIFIKENEDFGSDYIN